MVCFKLTPSKLQILIATKAPPLEIGGKDYLIPADKVKPTWNLIHFNY
jgi:hypothetical protein